METLLIRLLPLMQAVTQMDLVPTYSYTRIYKYGDTLHKHIDRKECEISTTLNLGGDPWPIYLQEKGKEEIKVDLKSGDMLVYKGNKLQHWRDPFMGYDCGQVFLHYNNKNGPFKDNNAFDSRPMIGLPKNFKRG
jgi:alkylated DNA repair dioxygenase AlkB